MGCDCFCLFPAPVEQAARLERPELQEAFVEELSPANNVWDDRRLQSGRWGL